MNQSRNIAPYIKNQKDNAPRTELGQTQDFYFYKVVNYSNDKHLFKVLKNNSLNVVRLEKDFKIFKGDIASGKNQFSLVPSNESIKDRIVFYHKEFSIVIQGVFTIDAFYVVSFVELTDDNINSTEVYLIENSVPDTFIDQTITQLNISSFKQLKGVKSVQFFFAFKKEFNQNKITSITLQTPVDSMISRISGKNDESDIEFNCDTIQPLWVIPQNIDDFKLTFYSPWLDNSKIYLPDWIRFDDYTNGFFNEEIFGDYNKCSPYRLIGKTFHQSGNYFDPDQLKLNKFYSALLFMVCFAWVYYNGFSNINNSLKESDGTQIPLIKSRVDIQLQSILKGNENISQASDSYINRYIKNGFTNEIKETNKFFAYTNMLGSFLYSQYNYFGGGTILNKILNPFTYEVDNSKFDSLCYFQVKTNHEDALFEDNWTDFDDSNPVAGSLIVSNGLEDSAKYPLITFGKYFFQDSHAVSAIEAEINNFSLLWLMTPLNIASRIERVSDVFKLSGIAKDGKLQKGNMDNEISLKLNSSYYNNTTKTIKLSPTLVKRFVKDSVQFYDSVYVYKPDESDFKQNEPLNVRIAFNCVKPDENIQLNNAYNIDTDKVNFTFVLKTAVPNGTLQVRNDYDNDISIKWVPTNPKIIEMWVEIPQTQDKQSWTGLSIFECYTGNETITLKNEYKNISQPLPVQAGGQNWIWSNLPNPITVNENLNTTPNQFKITPATLQGLMYFNAPDVKFDVKSFYSQGNSPFFTRALWKKIAFKYNPESKPFELVPTSEIANIQELYINGIYGGNSTLTINYEDGVKEEFKLLLFDDTDETVSLTTIRF